jgi:hypothetical protein
MAHPATTSRSSGTWPTTNTKPENEIELNTGMHSSELDRSQHAKPSESLGP